MASPHVVPIVGKMPAAAYRMAREELRSLYGDSAVERAGSFDQALASLFFRSGWTQEELAQVEGKTQRWVSRRLTFGRFLAFRPAGLIPKNLTEWRFRGYWDRTDTRESNDRIRFVAVQKLMEAELTLSKDRSPVTKRPVAEAILAQFADGGWHRLATIVEGVGADEADVVAVLTQMLTRGTYHTLCERRKGGTSWSYRIVRGHGRKVDVDVLVQELGPIVQALKVEGRKHSARWSPGTIAKLAHQLEAILERLTHSPVLPSRSTTKKESNHGQDGEVHSPES